MQWLFWVLFWGLNKITKRTVWRVAPNEMSHRTVVPDRIVVKFVEKSFVLIRKVIVGPPAV
jgi:hypothetical protein